MYCMLPCTCMFVLIICVSFILIVYNKEIKLIIECYTHQLSPRYEGQLMSDGGVYSPFRSILLVLTHDHIITHVFGPTDSDGHEWLNGADTGCAPH